MTHLTCISRIAAIESVEVFQEWRQQSDFEKFLNSRIRVRTRIPIQPCELFCQQCSISAFSSSVNHSCARILISLQYFHIHPIKAQELCNWNAIKGYIVFIQQLLLTIQNLPALLLFSSSPSLSMKRLCTRVLLHTITFRKKVAFFEDILGTVLHSSSAD